MAVTIDELQIEIQSRSTNAASGIDALERSLRNLRAAIAPMSKGGVGLTSLSNSIKNFSNSLSSLSGLSLAKTQIEGIASALKPLEKIQKSGFGSVASGLSKIAEVAPKIDSITSAIKSADMDAFAAQIQRVATAMRPLADEAAKVYVGLKWLPGVVNKVIASNGQLVASNIKTGKSFNILSSGWTKLVAGFYIAKRIGSVIGGWIKESNDYVENLNLFTVAMGEYAGSAQKYAEQVGELLGIDPSAWMRSQGVFMTLATGFGVAADKSALMSKNLTQLGYDISSFFNISVEDAMQKLQSGLSGELEPLELAA